MFKLSTRGDYGLLLMTRLAESYYQDRAFISLKEVAKEKHLSLRYLSQIILPLRQAGLVKSKEGRDGGYAMAKDPAEITMMEILEVLEGRLAPVRCCEKGGAKACLSENSCGVKTTWLEAQSMLGNFLKTKTLKDIGSVNTSAHVSN